MVLITWSYKNKQFYRMFKLSSHFHENYLKSVNMNPKLVFDVRILAKGRNSYPDRDLVVT